ncbi:MAG: hypothetical protein NT085_04180 [candidate division SR1 bacterium]|nr:hypothetical protein [candidate division SR1 bacterium]
MKNIVRRIQKYKRWEFWPSYIFDIPVYIYWILLGIKAGHILFFSNINPGMLFSGFSGYGKYDEIIKFDPALRPKTILIKIGDSFEKIKKEIDNENIKYPAIMKPNMGRTARDISKIYTDEGLRKHLTTMKEEYVIQEFIDDPLEFGILYYRIPGEAKGHITGVTDKRLVFVEGNGKHTLGELVRNHERARFYYKPFKKLHEKMWNKILPVGEKLQMNFLGNHCRGSCFYDATHLINANLEETIDKLSKTIPGFYYGRYDVKVKNIEDLYTGKYKIMELNGMGTLPVHIYDPTHNIRFAYKELFKHRNIIYKISKENHKRGHQYISLRKAREIVKKYGI